jgi:hypothetical protein
MKSRIQAFYKASNLQTFYAIALWFIANKMRINFILTINWES